MALHILIIPQLNYKILPGLYAYIYLLYVYVIPVLTYRRKVNSKTCVCKWPWKETLKSNYPIKVLYFSYFFQVNLAQCILAFEFYFLQSFIPPFSFHLWPGLKIGVMWGQQGRVQTWAWPTCYSNSNNPFLTFITFFVRFEATYWTIPNHTCRTSVLTFCITHETFFQFRGHSKIVNIKWSVAWRNNWN